MVAGALASFIAILAAIITVIVLRRKKQRSMPRGAVIHHPIIGTTSAFDSGNLSTSPRSATGMENPLVAPISAQLKRGSRQYDYVAEDVELTHRGSHGEYIPRLAHDGFRTRDDHTQSVQNSRNCRYSEQQSEVAVSSDGTSLSTAFAMHAKTTRTGKHEQHEKTKPPPSNSSATSAPALVQGGPETLPSPSGAGLRSALDISVLDVPPSLPNPAWIPTSSLDRGGDFPPPYEDVR